MAAHPDLHLFTRKGIIRFAVKRFEEVKTSNDARYGSPALADRGTCRKPSESVLRLIRTDKEANSSLQKAGEPDTYDWNVILSEGDKRGIKRLQTINVLNKKRAIRCRSLLIGNAFGQPRRQINPFLQPL
ncbi:hypothetical protein PO124_11345 [Bacillus licheniformis]|nr:hypothetical protein [Bacillus licheniformis]